jgi:hypothetical protein
MWLWVFLTIAGLGLIWHLLLAVGLLKKIKAIAIAAKPLVLKLSEISGALEAKPNLAAPKKAIDRPMDEVLVERLQIMKRRRKAKSDRQRRLIANLKKIDLSESRFTRVRKRS